MTKRSLARGLVCFLTLLLVPVVYAADDKATETERIRRAAEVLKEINATPETSIPSDLLQSAECVIIIPSMMKGGFIFGGNYGRGVADCREADGSWSSPSMMMIAGGSFGAQIGGEAVDLVLLGMNKKARTALESGSKVTLGAGASVSAGPVGRTAGAGTNAEMQAEFLTYSRSRGLFAGITLNGATLRPDEKGNEALYGVKVTPTQIFNGNVKPPAAAQVLITELNAYARRGSEARR